VFGQYQRLWKFVGQRDYEAVLKGVFVATVLVAGVISLLHPVEVAPPSASPMRCSGTVGCIPFIARPRPRGAVTLPASVISLFFLLSLAFLVGARFVVQLIADGRVQPFAWARAPARSDRRGGEGGGWSCAS